MIQHVAQSCRLLKETTTSSRTEIEAAVDSTPFRQVILCETLIGAYLSASCSDYRELQAFAFRSGWTLRYCIQHHPRVLFSKPSTYALLRDKGDLYGPANKNHDPVLTGFKRRLSRIPPSAMPALPCFLAESQTSA